MEKKTDGKRNRRRCNRSSQTLDRPRSWEPPSVKCFCRPLAGPIYRSVWHRMLELPPDFGATVADKVGQEIELRNCLGEKWPVVFSLYDGTVALRRGWKNFIDRHELKESDLLVFRNNGAHFKVEVYNGPTFCEKTLAYRPPSVVRFFKPLISDSWIDRLVLPDNISASVADKIGQETKLENALGENWTVTFSSYNGNVAFERGWEKFVRHHNLEEGDILVFRGFNDGSLFEVEVYDGKTFCEKACRMSLIRTQLEGQHGRPVPVYSNAGGNIASSSVPLRANFGSPPDQDTLSNAVLGSPPRGRHVREHSYAKRNIASSSVPLRANFGSPPDQDTISNAVLASPSRGRHVREQSYAKRNIASSSVPLSAHFGSPTVSNAVLGSPPRGRHVQEQSYARRKIASSSVRISANIGSPPDQDTVSNAVLGSPPHRSHVREHRYKKRKLDKRADSNSTRSPPQETSNETESPADPLPDQETVTCMAVTCGRDLVLPVELPVVQGLNRKGHQNSILLMDEGSRFWPASFYTGTKILSCPWGVFAAENGVQAGDRYSFTAVDRLTYKIDILPSA